MNSVRFAASRQRGASLIELMVAMVIGLVILLAVSEVFINNNRIRGEVERTGRQIENGVFALQMLEDELSNAGFWGETTVAGGGTVPPVCPTTLADMDDAMGYPVQPGAGACAGAIADIKAGSESLAIRRASSCALGTPNCQAVNGALHYVQVEACATAGDMGDVQLALGTAALANQTRDCTALAPIYRYLSRLYYVTDNDELARMELGTAGYVTSGPMVDGIEQLHFSFGIDGDGDGMVDSYTDAPTNIELADAIAVRIWLVARNLQPTQGYIDDRVYQLGDLLYEVDEDFIAHKRQVYSTVVTLRNVAGTREVQ
jgi:type IV pilus assembly protein PilW